MAAALQPVFTLEGKGLKLDSAADVEPHIGALVASDDVREVRLLGNSLGKGACRRLGEVLATKTKLEVRPPCPPTPFAATPPTDWLLP